MKLSPEEIEHLKLQVLLHTRSEDVVVLLDSNQIKAAAGLSTYEFLAAWGISKSLSINQANVFSSLQSFVDDTAGAWRFGYFTYDLKNQIEKLQSTNRDELHWPELFFFIPQHCIAIKNDGTVEHGEQIVSHLRGQKLAWTTDNKQAIHVQSRTEKSVYENNVNEIIQHIIDGNVYELNYCFELFADRVKIDPQRTYHQLKINSPTPFATFLKLYDNFLLSASPERFLTKCDNRLFSQPIKGTIRRGADANEDAELKTNLQHSTKERAENLMIVDLVRNDLARCAQTGTVKVEELFGLYSFKQVHQLISTVSATLKNDVSFTDIMKRTFPMGSMTGAPKIKAMELIDRYEQTKRGLYSGSVGYISPIGQFDFNVVIRSMQYHAKAQYLSMMVGSAITYDSIASQEYEECLLKANAMLGVFSSQIAL